MNAQGTAKIISNLCRYRCYLAYFQVQIFLEDEQSSLWYFFAGVQ